MESMIRLFWPEISGREQSNGGRSCDRGSVSVSGSRDDPVGHAREHRDRREDSARVRAPDHQGGTGSPGRSSFSRDLLVVPVPTARRHSSVLAGLRGIGDLVSLRTASRVVEDLPPRSRGHRLLARDLLPPLARNPHRFHEDKSEIAHDLAELARRVAPRSRRATGVKVDISDDRRGRIVVATQTINGKRVMVQRRKAFAVFVGERPVKPD
jgi:hypothetical protein